MPSLSQMTSLVPLAMRALSQSGMGIDTPVMGYK